MKKILFSSVCLVILLCILFGMLAINEPNYSFYSIPKTDEETIEIILPEGYYEIPADSNFTMVYSEKIPNSTVNFAFAKMEKCQFNIESLNYVGGDIIPSGFEYNDNLYTSRIRINKYDKCILDGDLIDTTQIEYYLIDNSLPLDIDSLEIEISFNGELLNLKNYDCLWINSGYYVKANIENSGNIFSNQIITVVSKYNSLPSEGFYVKKEAVQIEDNETFIRQVNYFQKKQYYKKVNVKIESDFGNYYKVSSSESIKNNLLVI